jgi:hypothetical protein
MTGASKYYSHGMAPYVYDWRGRAYAASQNGSQVRSELGGLFDGITHPDKYVPLGLAAVAAYVAYRHFFGSGRVRTVKR